MKNIRIVLIISADQFVEGSKSRSMNGEITTTGKLYLIFGEHNLRFENENLDEGNKKVWVGK